MAARTARSRSGGGYTFGTAHVLLVPRLDAAALNGNALRPMQQSIANAAQQGAQQGIRQGAAQGAAQGVEEAVEGATAKGVEEGAEKGAEEASSGVGATIAAGITAAIAAAGIGEAVGGAMERESGAANVAANFGLTPDEMRKAGKLAGQIYAGAYGDSLEQVNDAIKALAGTGRNIDLSIDDPRFKTAAQDILNLSSIMGEEPLKIAQAATKLVTTGMAPSIGSAMDLINRANQIGLNSSEDLLDTFNEYSVAWKSVGLTAPQALGALQQAVNAGARDTDIAADAFKELGIRVRDASADTTLQKMGINWKDAIDMVAGGGPNAAKGIQILLNRIKAIKDPFDRTNAAIALFGSQGEDLNTALGAIDLTTATKRFGEFNGVAADVNNILGSTMEATFTSWKRSMEVKVVDVVNDKVFPAFKTLRSLLKDGDYVNYGDFSVFGEESSKRVAAVLAVRDAFIKTKNYIGTELVPVAQRAGTAFVGWAKPYVNDFTQNFLPTVGKIKNAIVETFNVVVNGKYTGIAAALGMDDRSPAVAFLLRVHRGLEDVVDFVTGVVFPIGKEVVSLLFSGKYTGQAAAFGLDDKSGIVTFLLGIRETIISLKDNAVGIWHSLMDTDLLPNLTVVGRTIGTLALAVANLLLPVIRLAGDAIEKTFGFMARHETTVKVFAIAIAGLYGAMKLQAAITGIQAVGSLGAWIAATRIGTTVTAAFSAAKWILTGAFIKDTIAILANTFAIGENGIVYAITHSYIYTFIGVKLLELGAWLRSTAATVANTIAMTANRAVFATQFLYIFIAAKTAEAAAWVRSTAAAAASRVALIAMRGVVIATTAAQWALNAAILFIGSPIGFVIGMIAVLAVGLVLLWKNNETFRNGVIGAWEAITGAVGKAVGWFSGTVLPAIGRFFGGIGETAVRAGNFIIDKFKAVRDFLSTAFTAVGNILLAPIRAAISGVNAVIRGINRVRVNVPQWVPGVGGQKIGFNIPEIPALAQGGRVRARDGGVLALLGEAGRDEAVVDYGKLNARLDRDARYFKQLQADRTFQGASGGNRIENVYINSAVKDPRMAVKEWQRQLETANR